MRSKLLTTILVAGVLAGGALMFWWGWARGAEAGRKRTLDDWYWSEVAATQRLTDPRELGVRRIALAWLEEQRGKGPDRKEKP